MPMTLTDDEVKAAQKAFKEQNEAWISQVTSDKFGTATVKSAMTAFVGLVNNQVQTGRKKDPEYTVTEAMLELQKTNGTRIAL